MPKPPAAPTPGAASPGRDPAAAAASAAAAEAFLRDLHAERADGRAMRRTLPNGLRTTVAKHLAATRDALADPGAPPGGPARYRRLIEARRAIDVHDEDVRATVRGAIRDAAGRLRGTSSTAALADAAVREACDACGFSRVLISAVRGTRWVPLVVHSDASVDPDPETLRAFVDARNEIPLGTLLAETDIVRRRAAVLVAGDMLARRTFRPIVDAAGSSGYVGAPIRLGAEVVGIAHADRAGQRHGVTDDDRLLLAEFATVFGWLFGRASSEELLRSRARRIEADLDRARADLRSTRTPTFERASEVADRAGAPQNAPEPDGAPRDALLTGREREILELVAQGATNATVAQRLTLSEETVKSHVRRILRKLHVQSRSAAVARFRRLQDGDA